MMIVSSPLVPPHGDQLVVVADVDRDNPVGLDRRVVRLERSLLDLALAGREHEVLALVEGRESRAPTATRSPLAQRQQVDERGAPPFAVA